MNSIFRKTLIASALTAMFSTVAIAADDFSKTIDGSESNTQGEMQQNKSTNKQLTTPNHEDEFNQTIDAEGPSAGNRADPEQTDRPLTDHQSNVVDEPKHNVDADAPSAGTRSDQEQTDRPLTKHQSNVTEEEEEEEEIGNSQMDKSSDVHMDEQPHGPTGAGTPANRGGLYDMSADALNGMDVITSDGESVGDIEKIVMSPGNQNVHAVITIGGLFGVGGKTILIPLEKFTYTNDELHVRATQSQLEKMTDYGSEEYIELEGDAAISSALKP